MQQTTFIQYPYDDLINHQFLQIEDLTSEWIDEYDVPDKVKMKYKMARSGHLAARFFPIATFEQLIPFARFTIWLFIYDDQYGPMPLEELQHSNKRCLDVLNGSKILETDNSYVKQLAKLRKELLPFVTDKWMFRFIQNVKNYFEGMEADTKYSYHNLNYPTVEEYIKIREDIAATHPVVDFIEIESGFILPNEIILHPVLFQMKRLVCRLVAWCNDCYSWEKELKDNEAMNLVLVFKNQLKCSMEEAFDAAVKLHDMDLDEFENLKEAVPDFGDANSLVDFYIYNLELFLQGHKSWYEDTMRYRVGFNEKA